MHTNNTISSSIADIHLAVEILQQGGLVAFPTETVYGLGADASNARALQKLYAIKGRPTNHPVIVHLADIEQLSEWGQDIPPIAFELGNAFWPGPLTLILRRRETVLDEVTGGQGTVGVRIPDHPVALALLKQFGRGVAAPSANRFGRLSPTRADHVRADLGHDIDYILDGGPCTIGVESTIIDLTQDFPTILRPGMISLADLNKFLGIETETATSKTTIRVPGALPSHYAPNTPLEIVPLAQLPEKIEQYQQENISVALLTCAPFKTNLPPSHRVLGSNTPQHYAQTLYANLRQLDTLGCQRILVEAVPNEGLWQAVFNRLQRAANTFASIQGEATHV